MLLWLVLGLGALLFVWLRGAKQARQRWLEALNLLGKWELEAAGEGAGPRRSLTLSGDLAPASTWPGTTTRCSGASGGCPGAR